ncbi:hypothetical protein G4Y79_10170 [Phototrophicus methaneseepsis]|uniref:Uncharacterized protein n=1 Tax=Phototrophicus methaneseepsis TaxID=2710758 RepID=A0A7S8IH09_9CHLR|nr:hypothetical protein [Phototrophicus methaneseepsis]QPC84718.1 hypothetical protein G4Y79_10170 [Phototrophicus methaneseepsis]
MIEFKEVSYGGWSTCYQVSNGIIDLIITGEVGPRIIRLGFNDGPNQFCNVDEDLGKTGGDEWLMYGGHRFWHAPEDEVRTYYPDNVPVTVEENNGIVTITQPTETTTGLQKQIILTMNPDSAQVKVTHKLTNHSPFAITCAPWALSVMRPGGKAILPLPPRGSHPEDLLPVNSLIMWSYDDMSDPRWTWGKRFILLSQDVNNAQPQKLGASIPDGWVAHLNDGVLFVKQFDIFPEATYPDMGSHGEVFTNDYMLELETVGVLGPIEPESSAEHTETWNLFQGVGAVSNDADVEANVLPKVESIK